MYRKEIKVLDCTIRDGGLMNNHLFSDDLVRGVFQAVNQSGVDYIELGYKADENQFKRGEFGPMKFCSEKDLENIIGDTELNCKVSVMADIGRFDPKSVVPKAESYIDMMRVASYVKDIDKAIEIVNTLNKKVANLYYYKFQKCHFLLLIDPFIFFLIFLQFDRSNLYYLEILRPKIHFLYILFQRNRYLQFQLANFDVDKTN